MRGLTAAMSSGDDVGGVVNVGRYLSCITPFYNTSSHILRKGLIAIRGKRKSLYPMQTISLFISDAVGLLSNGVIVRYRRMFQVNSNSAAQPQPQPHSSDRGYTRSAAHTSMTIVETWDSLGEENFK